MLDYYLALADVRQPAESPGSYWSRLRNSPIRNTQQIIQLLTLQLSFSAD